MEAVEEVEKETWVVMFVMMEVLVAPEYVVEKEVEIEIETKVETAMKTQMGVLGESEEIEMEIEGVNEQEKADS